ncbi:hypothetical protein AYL99_11536 [Fonsecaea erecta]|uniref:Uncharacterized protein n=1 Tax=Fonsecaea erecta TaxID=1367422 RepID=A0A178Z5U9_9EURO|nr:hypothetical protein AYL99_11536 [Fonsecaea erecta]OAP54435.1 hypothetical protein AYL99_11536 [Fonsecaea erecta]
MDSSRGLWQWLIDSSVFRNVALRFANTTGGRKYNGNIWETHFTPPAQVLVEKLMIRMHLITPFTSKDASENHSYTASSNATSFVDSNQIYLLGLSTGGDVVYLGDEDSAYDRNTCTVDSTFTLDAAGNDKLVYAVASRSKQKTEQQADGTTREWVDEAEVADTLFTV